MNMSWIVPVPGRWGCDYVCNCIYPDYTPHSSSSSNLLLLALRGLYMLGMAQRKRCMTQTGVQGRNYLPSLCGIITCIIFLMSSRQHHSPQKVTFRVRTTTVQFPLMIWADQSFSSSKVTPHSCSPNEGTAMKITWPINDSLARFEC